MPQTFHAQLTSKGPGGGWTHVLIPFSVHEVFGSRGRTPVAGTLAGAPFRSSIFPEGDGTHYLNVTKAVMAAAGVKPGDTVEVVIEVDRAERIVTISTELQHALDQYPAAATVFHALAYSHRKEYVDWIDSARRPETRTARIEKTIERLQSPSPRRP